MAMDDTTSALHQIVQQVASDAQEVANRVGNDLYNLKQQLAAAVNDPGTAAAIDSIQNDVQLLTNLHMALAKIDPTNPTPPDIPIDPQPGPVVGPADPGSAGNQPSPTVDPADNPVPAVDPVSSPLPPNVAALDAPESPSNTATAVPVDPATVDASGAGTPSAGQAATDQVDPAVAAEADHVPGPTTPAETATPAPHPRRHVPPSN